jgi:Caspase domain
LSKHLGRASLFALLVLGLTAWAVLRVRADDAAALRRFALVVAANDGGPLRPPLRHAESDARSMAAVLAELGGVLARDANLLLEPTVSAIRAALLELDQSARALEQRGVRSELVFYYSGHSDESGLLLGAERLSYRELRELLKALHVDVRIAILDSCASGAFTREKGGKKRAPFMLDASSAVRGHAFLTSASEDEAAQESDTVGGSFFTHFLVSGLRGAADASGDGKVTLNEAYRYAFDETLSRTGDTRFGAQHPAYDIRLVGTGDLVLSDLRVTGGELVLAGDLAGRIFVRDEAGRLFVELSKTVGKPRALALPAGHYVVDLVSGRELLRASVDAGTDGKVLLEARAFRKVERLVTSGRGARYAVRPAAAAVVFKLSTNRLSGAPDLLNYFNLALIYDEPAALDGLQLSLGGALVRDRVRGVQLAPVFAATRAFFGLQLALVSYAETGGSGLGIGGVSAIVDGHMRGLLVAPMTWARRLSGVSLGAVNTAATVEGLQIGVINVVTKSVRGVSIGVINYAEEADVSLAPIAYTRQGGVHAQLSLQDTSLLNLALRLDATYNYSFVSVGVHPIGKEARRGYALGAGLGVKVPLYARSLWLDMDLSFQLIQPEKSWLRGVPNSIEQLRLLLRYELYAHLSFFAGPTLNVLLQTDRERRADLGFALRRYVLTEADAIVRVALWPGFALGLRF